MFITAITMTTLLGRDRVVETGTTADSATTTTTTYQFCTTLLFYTCVSTLCTSPEAQATLIFALIFTHLLALRSLAC